MFDTHRLSGTLLGLSLACGLGAAAAATATLTTSISRVSVIGNDNFGGCMAQLAVGPESKLAGCLKGYVTFDCAAVLEGTDPVRAYRMLDQAQLALAGKRQVMVYFRDDKTVDGACLAYRIDAM
jgi:hypothetical protein